MKYTHRYIYISNPQVCKRNEILQKKSFTNLSNIKLKLEKLNDIRKFETVSTSHSIQH